MTLHGHLPQRAGVGFKPAHFGEIVAAARPPAFFEVHAENYMGAGGPSHRQIERLHASAALSVHGVGLSIGGDALDKSHLANLALLCERHQPECFSEHLAWSTHEGAFFNDLLPLPYTRATLDRVCAHIDETQSVLRRRMLLENPATYVIFEESELSETDFLAEVARRTGCGLLLDINNVAVCAANHGFDAHDYLGAFPLHAVEEVHLAGHDEQQDKDGAALLIDTHDRPVGDYVWRLYAEVIAQAGPLPTLIEWDNDVPAWPVLAREAKRADAILLRETADA
jgi:uncharacterized protein (UPF0276 family)